MVAVAALVAATTASAESLTLGPNSPLQPFHQWTVPAGVCGATFDLFGAEGSGGVGGARVTTTMVVKPGTSFYVFVGGWGTRGNGGYNGGGDASGTGMLEGVGGGGATDVRTGPGLTERILVAGGGGGSGGSSSVGGLGGPGGLLGQNGSAAQVMYAGGGGGGGTATAGGTLGAAGPPADGFKGQAGTLGFGGAGGVVPDGFSPGGFGGGGGGGLYGGGGGGAGGTAPGGGGGGGSSLAAGGMVNTTTGGNGKAVITYTASSTCVQSPGGGGAGDPGPGQGGGVNDVVQPTIGALAFSHSAFAAAKSGAATSARKRRKPPVGTRVSFTLSEPSSVFFTVERKARGRKVGGRCAKPKRSSHGRRCTRWVAVKGSFSVSGVAGENSFTFRGRVGGKSLAPASYRLNSQATDGAKNISLPQSKGFKIVK